MSYLLEDVTVVDAATFLAGPGAATVMADFGANVIKIEPPGGDGYRTLRWPAPGAVSLAAHVAQQAQRRSRSQQRRRGGRHASLGPAGRRADHQLPRRSDAAFSHDLSGALRNQSAAGDGAHERVRHRRGRK